MVACTNFDYAYAAWRIDNSHPRFSISTIYLCNILSRLNDGSRSPLIALISTNRSMVKIKIKKKKKRIPLPQKPPKVEKNKKAYDRKKSKADVRLLTKDELK